MKIKEAFAVYTGGNIWLFYGQLENGSYFLTDDYGWTQILNADPSDLEESTYQEWQDEHLIKELSDKVDLMYFLEDLLNYLRNHPDNCGGMTEDEIEVYRNYFIEVNCGKERKYV